MKFALTAWTLLAGSQFDSITAASVETKKVDSGKKCLALSMSGGGTKGAFEAGVLWGMYYAMEDKTEFEYDVVTGVSAGSLNTMAVALHPKGDEEAMVKEMSDRWATLKQDNLFTQWKPFGILTGLTNKSGIFNTANLGKYVQDYIDQYKGIFQRKFVVSSVDVNTGTYNLYDEKTPKDTAKAALSSASIPFAFPTQKWEGHTDMDGGTVWNTNIISAIDRCREQVDDDSQITVDIITCGAPMMVEQWEDTKNGLNNYLRYDDIRKADNQGNDIYDVMHAFPSVNYRYYVVPTGKLAAGLKSINTDNSTVTWPMQEIGRNDGKNEVESKSGFKNLIEQVEKKEASKMKGTIDLDFVQK